MRGWPILYAFFTVDPLCFISEAIFTRKNAYIRKRGQFCMHFYDGSALLGLSWTPVYERLAIFVCIFTVDPLCWGWSWKCVYGRVANFVCIFTVDPLCFISEARFTLNLFVH